MRRVKKVDVSDQLALTSRWPHDRTLPPPHFCPKGRPRSSTHQRRRRRPSAAPSARSPSRAQSRRGFARRSTGQAGTSGVPSTETRPRRAAWRTPGPEPGRRSARSRALLRSGPSRRRRAKPGGVLEVGSLAARRGRRSSSRWRRCRKLRGLTANARQATSTPTLGANAATRPSSMAVTSARRSCGCVAARAPIPSPGRLSAPLRR